MSDDPGPLFARAAVLAAEFRRGIATARQRPEHAYAAAVPDWEGPTPETGQPAEAVLEELVARAGPGLHASTGPRFFGWVIGGSHPAGVAADWMTSAWGQNVGNHQAAPAASAAELVSGKWLVDILGLPEGCSVGFVTGATMANLVGMAAGRSEVLRRVGWDVEADGLFGAPPIRVVVGEDIHVSALSALQFLGLGHSRVIKVATDGEGRMIPAALAAALEAGSGPAIVMLQAGQINTGACDPFPDLIPIARAHGAWVHVDGAFGLWAKAAPERAALAVGVEDADSWATDGHKWLQSPYDTGFAIVRDPEAHRRAMAFGASYLPSVAAGERDPTHYVPELSRRARGFATWALLRHFGRAGIAEMVERNCRVAGQIADALRGEPGIAVVNAVALNQVILRFGADREADADRLTLATVARLQSDGIAFAGASQWRGQWLMRVSVSSYATTEADGQMTAGAIRAAWHTVRGSNA
ncbi:MAG: aminotransferase class V-fold PLP-dependent enzyme [Alphaproteobacteria bacterium]|nr:aminotransferase class V-fold PLP-dependent enzyme [Alphaproteobacteria bacterium]